MTQTDRKDEDEEAPVFPLCHKPRNEKREHGLHLISFAIRSETGPSGAGSWEVRIWGTLPDLLQSHPSIVNLRRARLPMPSCILCGMTLRNPAFFGKAESGFTCHPSAANRAASGFCDFDEEGKQEKLLTGEYGSHSPFYHF